MRGLGRFSIVVVAMAMVAAACGGGGDETTDDALDAGGDVTATTAPTTAPLATTAGGTTGPAASLTLRITDVRLFNSEESDSGMRVLLPGGVATASVTVTGLPTPNHVISVCQARELERRMTGATCRTPANGEAVNLALGTAASGIELVQAGLSSPGPAGNETAIEEITIRYAASSREVNVRLPQIASGDRGGRPTFRLTPPSADGTYRANLTWTVILVFGGGPTNGQVELLQGGQVANQAQAAADVRLTGTVSPPGTEAAIRIQNLGTAALVSPKLSAVLP